MTSHAPNVYKRLTVSRVNLLTITSATGALRDESARELHNTLYAAESARRSVTGVAGSARRPRRPRARAVAWPAQLVALRDSIRSALQARRSRTSQDVTALDTINRSSARRPALAVRGSEPGRRSRRRRGAPRREPRSHRRRGVRAGCDRPAHRPQGRRLARVRSTRLHPAVRQGPSAPRVVLQRLRQSRTPGKALRARPATRLTSPLKTDARGRSAAAPRRGQHLGGT